MFFILLKELRDAAHQFPVFIHTEPIGLVSAHNFGISAQFVNLFARSTEVRHRNRLDHISFKGSETAAAQNVRNVLHCQIDPQIRFVASVGFHRLEIRDPPERRRGCRMIPAILGKNRRQHFFQYRKHVFLCSESHFHIQLVKLTRAPVSTGIFVTEARSNLKIAVKPAGHQQLLELLRSLRQRIEHTGMFAGRDQIVTRTFRGGRSQDRCGNFQESLLCHSLPQFCNHIAPENDVLLHFWISQVQIPVFQANAFICFTAPADLERQCVIPAFSKHFNAFRHHFNVTGRHPRILVISFPDNTAYGYNAFLIQVQERLQDLLVLGYQLSRTIKIA